MIRTFFGNNTYALHQRLHELINQFVQKNGDLAIERFDGEELELDTLLASLQATGLFAQQRLVIVRSLSKNKVLAEAIESVIDASGEGTELILLEPDIDKRTRLFKLLKKDTKAEEFGELGESALQKWVVETARERGGSINPSAARFLIEHVGNDQWRLSGEIDKLSAYAGEITADSIKELVEPSPQETIFELLDQAASGRSKSALETYDSLRRQQLEPAYVLSMLAWQLHNLAVAKTAGERSQSEVSKDTGISPFVIQKSQRLVRNLRLQDIRTMYDETAAADMQLKTSAVDADQLLKQLLMKFSS